MEERRAGNRSDYNLLVLDKNLSARARNRRDAVLENARAPVGRHRWRERLSAYPQADADDRGLCHDYLSHDRHDDRLGHAARRRRLR